MGIEEHVRGLIEGARADLARDGAAKATEDDEEAGS